MRLIEIDKEDVNHKAIVWALSRPNLQQLCRDIYVTRDTKDDAQRFEKSDEFKECLRLIKVRTGGKQTLKLLDVGCGNGTASWAFAKNGMEVTATDLCVSDICGLNAAKKLQGFQTIKFDIVRGDAHHFDFPSEQYDVVFCRQVLHHADDLDAFVKELGRVLKPGGVFMATREQVAETQEQLKELLDNHPLNHITQDEGAFSHSEYISALRLGGLKKIETLGIYDNVINYFPQRDEAIYGPIYANFGRYVAAVARRSSILRKILRRKLSKLHAEGHFTLESYIANKAV